MQKIYLLISVFVLVLTALGQVDQGVCISNFPVEPASSAMLEVRSDSKGLLIPRMTKAQRDLILSPARGLWIYQLDDVKGFYCYEGNTWVCMSCCCNKVEEGWKEIGSEGKLIDGSPIPKFGSCFQPVATPSAGKQKLSIRRTIDGKIRIKGEFVMNCAMSTFSWIPLFGSEFTTAMYRPLYLGATVLSPTLRNGVESPLTMNMKGGTDPDNPIPTNSFYITFLGSAINANAFKGSVYFIDIEFIPVQ